MSRNSTLLLFKMKEERVWWCADENDLASCKTEGMELEQSGGCGISQKCTKLLRERDQNTRSTDEKRWTHAVAGTSWMFFCMASIFSVRQKNKVV